MYADIQFTDANGVVSLVCDFHVDRSCAHCNQIIPLINFVNGTCKEGPLYDPDEDVTNPFPFCDSTCLANFKKAAIFCDNCQSYCPLISQASLHTNGEIWCHRCRNDPEQAPPQQNLGFVFVDEEEQFLRRRISHLWFNLSQIKKKKRLLTPSSRPSRLRPISSLSK